jgi:hypothetical protein
VLETGPITWAHAASLSATNVAAKFSARDWSGKVVVT